MRKKIYFFILIKSFLLIFENNYAQCSVFSKNLMYSFSNYNLMNTDDLSKKVEFAEEEIVLLIERVAGMLRKKKYNQALLSLGNISRFNQESKNYKRILFLEGYLNLKLSNYDYALKIFKSELLEKYKRVGDYIMFFTAKAYSGLKKHKEARLVLTKLKKLYPKNSFDRQLNLDLAMENFLTERYKTTVILLKKFIKKYKGSEEIPSAFFLLGKAYEKQKKYIDSYNAYKSIYYKYPFHRHAKMAEEKLVLIEKYKKGMPEPKDSEVLKRAIILKSSGSFKKAVRELEQLSRKNNSSKIKIKALYNLGECYISMGHINKGIKLLEGIVKKRPKHKITPRIYYKIAYTYWNKGYSKKSILYANKVLKRFPKSIWTEKTLYLLGKINESRGNKKQTIKYFSMLIEKFPKGKNAAKASWSMGWTYFLHKEYGEAVQVFEKAIVMYKNYDFMDKILYWQARAYEEKEALVKANSIYKKLKMQFPYSYYGHKGGARELLLNRDKEKKISNNDNRKVQFPLIYNKALEYEETFKGKKKKSIEKVKELFILGLNDEASKEINIVLKYLSKKHLDSTLFLTALYYKANRFKNYFNILNNYMYIVSKKNNINNLSKAFWEFYYPLAYWDEVFFSASENVIDPLLIEGLIRQESLFNNMALSRVGAAGLMQLMNDTAKREGKRLKLSVKISKEALFTPSLNIKIGTYHFKGLLKKFKEDVVLALISYNAGANKAYEWKKRFKTLEQDMFIESIPYKETRNFVKSVMRNYYNYMLLYRDN